MRKRVAILVTLMLFFTAVLAPSTALAYDELKNTDPEKYYIVLDLTNQIVTVYEKDADGAYTRIVRRFLCTTGRTETDPEDPEDEGTPTPTGIWKIGGRERFGKFANYGSEYARYWVQIVGSVFFHSIMFGRRDVNYMKKSAFSNLGKNVSHGCVRLYVEDAKWLYYYACPGTTLLVTTGVKRNNTLKKALRSSLSFSNYNELQKNFYDEPELENPKCWVAVDGARIRRGNGSEYPSVVKTAAGDELEILLLGEAWVKVRTAAGKEGYIRRGHVTLTEGVLDSSSDAKLIRATVWMFSQKDSDSDYRICKVPTDVSVHILEADTGDGWTKIAYWNEIGYIKTNSLTTGWGVVYDS